MKTTMGYVKLKKTKTSKMHAIAESNFDMSFLESLVITAALDGLIDQNNNTGLLSKGKQIHKLK